MHAHIIAPIMAAAPSMSHRNIYRYRDDIGTFYVNRCTRSRIEIRREE